ncbi:MAG: DUF4907 domain-containing protein [Chitinophagales bacterium]
MILENLFFVFLFATAGDFRASKHEYVELISIQKEDTISYQILESPGKSFGYDIFADNRLLIHQPNIPGIPGTNGFTRKKDAEKVAQLVVKKIKQGMMPPTIEKKDLDSLEIVY